MVKLGLVYKSLFNEDFVVLQAMEKLHLRREYIPLSLLERVTGFHEEKLVLILSKLHSLSLVKRETVSDEKMYRLTYTGYDMIALRALVAHNVIEALGDKIGEGKESEIYEGLAPGGVHVAVKFLRLGRTSFRKTARVRDWALRSSFSWYKQSVIAAEKEYKALRELVVHKALVPAPIGYSRHVVVIEYIDGVELYKKPELLEPSEVLTSILETLAIAYHKAQIVHGDLSEYNILVERESERPYIIDWPQYVYREDPRAGELLKRDVSYIVRFFKKNYRVDITEESALKLVTEYSSK
jgi:RIO kinase 2